MRSSADLRWELAGRHGSPPGIFQFLGQLLGLYGTAASVGLIRPTYAPPEPAAAPMVAAEPQFDAVGVGTYPTPATPAAIPLPAATTAVGWLRYIAERYGPAIAQAVVDAYQNYRSRGLSESAARAAAKKQVGVKTRRRMNPTNIRALRRSIRRVRSFQRVTRKVNRLLPRATRRGRVIYRRARRGDVDPFIVEDLADVSDEAEDLGYEPDYFREESEL